MHVSLVVRSRNEADRLRLTLTSLAQQSTPVEVIVVNDGSTDHTPAVLLDASRWMPLTVITHATSHGRSGAANVGARAAKGEVLLFLDGDTLAGPELVARHAAIHGQRVRVIGRGETFHLRGVRFFRNPETGEPWPGDGAPRARLLPGEITRLLVRRDQVVEDFAGIEQRATPGIYPGSAPRRLYELEMEALVDHPECTMLWAAACGSNLSVRRDDFLRVGGFNEALDINEHRELALKVCLSGALMMPVMGARTYHLSHGSHWRDPLTETAWEEVFYRAHPSPAVKLLSVFWASLSPSSKIPREAQIRSLLELEAAARGETAVDYDAVRRLIPALPVLNIAPQRATSRQASSAS